MRASYHNHSTYSDGKATFDELIAWAREHHVTELGFSDHLALHPSGIDPKWAMSRTQLPTYVQEILQHQQALAGQLQIRLGLEVDWYPGAEDRIVQTLADYPWDYLIGSVHEINGFTVDHTAEPWKKLTAQQRDDIHQQYWIYLRAMAESGLFDIAAHLDLPKKFGYLPQRDLSREINLALDAIAQAGMVVELNTAGWHKRINDAYPSEAILQCCFERDIPVTISADAHQSDHLLRDFTRAVDRLRAVGYRELARFAQRSARFESLENNVA